MMNIDTLKSILDERTAQHNQLVESYDKAVEERNQMDSKIIQIEKQIIHNQGAIQMLNDLGAQMMNETAPEVNTETIPAEAVEIVQ